jgi:hypothetical protein
MPLRALLFVALVLPSTLAAQDPSSFRAGQWAAQFTGGSSFASLGAIKFRSPTRALVLDVRVSAFHQENYVNDVFQGVNSDVGVGLRLGRRSYRPIVDKVVAFHSLGVLVGFEHSVRTTLFFPTTTLNGWSAGAFGELGGVYLVSSHFGIGATATWSFMGTSSSGKDTGGAKTRAWSVEASTGISFAATIYF